MTICSHGIDSSDCILCTTQMFHITPDEKLVNDECWPEELCRRCKEIGYGNVLFGHCDVEGVDKNGVGFCRQTPHGKGPLVKYRNKQGTNSPAILCIMNDLGVPYISSACHWAGLDLNRFTLAQKVALERVAVCNWVCEREGL
jgi:hypothetical protein